MHSSTILCSFFNFYLHSFFFPEATNLSPENTKRKTKMTLYSHRDNFRKREAQGEKSGCEDRRPLQRIREGKPTVEGGTLAAMNCSLPGGRFCCAPSGKVSSRKTTQPGHTRVIYASQMQQQPALVWLSRPGNAISPRPSYTAQTGLLL